ncbi:MAG: LysE family transporter [Alphaproteobacteria bacterium]|nr:LysE family transporter [Alphaproteobacteria bacterium]
MDVFLSLLTYFSILALFALKPGPGVLFFVSMTLSDGPKAALVTGLGTDIGHCIILSCLLLGFNIIEAHPDVVLIIQISASLYIGYLGVLILLNKQKKHKKRHTLKTKSNLTRILKGMVWASTNPTNAVFYAALVPVLILQISDFSIFHILSLSVLTGITFFIARLPYIYFANKAQGYIVQDSVRQKLNMLSGGVFVFVSMMFLFFLVPEISKHF